MLGKIYCVLPDPQGWRDAAAACRAHDGHLARMRSRVDEVALRSALASPVPAQSLWIDLRRGSAGFLWGDAQTPLAAGRWMQGEPNDSGGAEDCADWSTSSGRYNDLPCAAHRGVLCEIPPAATCHAELVKTQSARYCMYPRAMLSHGEARVLCQRTGGSLAMLESDEEDDALRATLGSLVGADRVWVGMSDAQREGTWRWESGDAVSHGWLPGEPNDAGGAEDCGEWWPQTGGFNDVPCGRQLPALCEIAP